MLPKRSWSVRWEQRTRLVTSLIVGRSVSSTQYSFRAMRRSTCDEFSPECERVCRWICACSARGGRIPCANTRAKRGIEGSASLPVFGQVLRPLPVHVKVGSVVNQSRSYARLDQRNIDPVLDLVICIAFVGVVSKRPSDMSTEPCRLNT